tara:strand:+ start:3966 stop:5309 length:1344 start_codon:yes stop_codon:yes gene_type:complete
VKYHNHIINDPIHGIMDFTSEQNKLIKKYIDTDLFQRLRRIKQLGCADYVFPGATHTRFSHSLGACYLAKNLCEYLGEDIGNKDDMQSIILATLLHDIGHGPFSHSFENILNNDLPDKKKLSHDKGWLFKFLDVFKSIDSKYAEEISLVEDIFNNKSNYKKDIVSSQLDVDRLDYLMRDSHFCGVPYGNIDLKWILNSLQIITKNNNKFLAIKSEGIGAVEHYLSARRLMTKNIYHNPKICSGQYYIKEFISSLEDHLDSKDELLINSNLMKFMKKYFDYRDNNKINQSDFINDTFDIYKELTDDDIIMKIKLINQLKPKTKSYEISQALLKRKLPICHQLNSEKLEDSEAIINDYKNKLPANQRWKIHIDKFNIQTYKSKNNPIYVTKNDLTSNIQYESGILNYHSNKDEAVLLLYIDSTIDKHEEIKKTLNSKNCFLFPYKNNNV